MPCFNNNNNNNKLLKLLFASPLNKLTNYDIAVAIFTVK